MERKNKEYVIVMVAKTYIEKKNNIFNFLTMILKTDSYKHYIRKLLI